MVYNTLNKLSVDCRKAERSFNDAENFSEYSREAVGVLASMGIVNGTGDGNFEPQETATRAQAAVIIHNMLVNIR